jgi:L-iditol 2-dehydrogenase
VRTLAVGICGSDLHVFEGRHPFVHYPVFPGHEVAGTIIEVGPEVDDKWRGSLVTLEPSLTCGVCDACRLGHYNVCENLKVMGFQAPGGMAESFIAPIRNLHALPEGTPPEIGAMIEPLAVAAHAVALTDVRGRSVGVVGAGTIGLLVAQVARAYGAAQVVVADLLDPRRRLAQQLGFTLSERLSRHDTVLECVGVEEALDAAIRATRKGGTVILVGVYGGPTSIPAALVQDWELILRGSLMYTFRDYREAIRLVTADLVNLAALISHRYSLGEVAQAFGMALERAQAQKVILRA